MTSAGAKGSRLPRQDQVRNRRRLLDAARRALLADNDGVSLDEIAGSAGLAPASLFRHFGSRQQLLDAVMDDLLEGVRKGAATAAQMDDPLDGLRYLLSRACRMSDAEVTLFGRLAQSSAASSSTADRLIADLVSPVARALAAHLRLDLEVAVGDLVVLVRMLELSTTDEQRDRLAELVVTGICGARLNVTSVT